MNESHAQNGPLSLQFGEVVRYSEALEIQTNIGLNNSTYPTRPHSVIVDYYTILHLFIAWMLMANCLKLVTKMNIVIDTCH